MTIPTIELVCPDKDCPGHALPMLYVELPDVPVICGICGEGVLHMPEQGDND